MLIEQGTNNGYHPSTVVGVLTADPLFNVTPKGKHHTIFYVRYGNKREENGKFTAKSILCEAWDGWADNCNCFEKGDNVVIFGTKQPDEYRGKKTGEKVFKVVVEFAINAGTLYGVTDVNNENTSVSGDSEQTEEESGFFA